jgi:hypothetical protein
MLKVKLENDTIRIGSHFRVRWVPSLAIPLSNPRSQPASTGGCRALTELPTPPTTKGSYDIFQVEKKTCPDGHNAGGVTPE